MQIERLQHEIESNPRLDAVFHICKELNIDDPIHWFNTVPPITVDWWIAYLSLVSKRENDSADTSKGKEMSPDSAQEYLSKFAS